MVHIRFSGLVFGLLFVLHALNSISVHAHQGGETMGERLVDVSSEETLVSVQKEFLDGFGGRKMGGHEVVVVRKEIGDKHGLEVGASKNSGGNNDAEIMSIGKFQDQANNQVIGINNLEPKTGDLAGLGLPRNDQPFHLPNSMRFEEFKTVPPKGKPVIGSDRVESKRLLEAAKEILNLMHKDYKGYDRPRRNPPINNHVPRH